MNLKYKVHIDPNEFELWKHQYLAPKVTSLKFNVAIHLISIYWAPTIEFIQSWVTPQQLLKKNRKL